MKVNVSSADRGIVGSALKDPHPFPGKFELSHHWDDTLKDDTKNYPSVLGLSFFDCKNKLQSPSKGRNIGIYLDLPSA